ncbi:MAG: hypothetical protein AABY65_14085 [Nitrospirota bacterium]
MKGKISATVERPLLDFLDSLPGKTRSEKLEHVLEAFRRWADEKSLRRQLERRVETDDERAEREAWERTMEKAMWTE